MPLSEQWFECPHCGWRYSARARSTTLELEIPESLVCPQCGMTHAKDLVPREFHVGIDELYPEKDDGSESTT